MTPPPARNERYVARLRIRDESDVAAVRARLRELSHAEGLELVATEAFATAVTEIVRNVLVHAGFGEALLGSAASQGRHGVIAVVRDDGPGIGDIARALMDGVTTGSGLGLGLPSAKRLVDEFEIDSVSGRGTTITLIKWISSSLG